MRRVTEHLQYEGCGRCTQHAGTSSPQPLPAHLSREQRTLGPQWPASHVAGMPGSEGAVPASHSLPAHGDALGFTFHPDTGMSPLPLLPAPPPVCTAGTGGRPCHVLPTPPRTCRAIAGSWRWALGGKFPVLRSSSSLSPHH